MPPTAVVLSEDGAPRFVVETVVPSYPSKLIGNIESPPLHIASNDV